jgi:flagella basal body P-ring formation protein FlgA
MGNGCTIQREILKGLAIAVLAGTCVAFWYECCKNPQALKTNPDLSDKLGNQLVPIVYCVKDVPRGLVVELDDLETHTIEMDRCPANVVTTPWIAVGRTAKRGLHKGKLVYFEDFGLALKQDSKPAH